MATSGLEFRGEVLLQRPGQSPRPTWTKKSGAAQLVPEPARPRGVAMKDKMFHVVSDVFACFLNACCSAQKLEARNLGGRRKLLSRILLYPHIIGSCAPGAAGARTSGHPSTGRTPVYKEDTDDTRTITGHHQEATKKYVPPYTIQEVKHWKNKTALISK